MFVAADRSVIMFVDSAVVAESVLFGNVSRNAVRERVWGGVLGNVIVNNLEQQKIISQIRKISEKIVSSKCRTNCADRFSISPTKATDLTAKIATQRK